MRRGIPNSMFNGKETHSNDVCEIEIGIFMRRECHLLHLRRNSPLTHFDCSL